MSNQWNNNPPQDGTITNERQEAPSEPSFTGFTPVDEFEASPKRKHSGLGIASFSIFGAMALAFIVLLIVFVAGIFSKVDLNGETLDAEEFAAKLEDMPELAVIGFLMFGTVIGHLVGLVLGIVGLVHKERKKVFAVLGTVLNGLVIGLLLFLFFLGIALSSAV